MSDLTAVKGNWDEDFKEKEQSTDTGENSKVPFMKFQEPGQYRIRLIGGHVKFLRHFNPISAITHADYKDRDPAWKAGFYPGKRYAIHMIDRKDGKLKILERGNGLFQNFANFSAIHGINPAGKDSPDFIIVVKIPIDPKTKKPNKYNTEYHVEAARENSPLTAEEIEMYKANKVPLQEIFKAAPLEKIQELWDKLPEEARIPKKKEFKGKGDGRDKGSDKQEAKEEPKQEQKQTLKEEMKDAPADKEDPFKSEEPAESKDDSSDLF